MRTQVFTVQQIYRGWWIVGLLLPAGLIVDVRSAALEAGAG